MLEPEGVQGTLGEAFDVVPDDAEPAKKTRIAVSGIPATRATLKHYRIDQEHGNSYAAWKRMGSPAQPSAAQIGALRQASELALQNKPGSIAVRNGTAVIRMQLPRQAVSLLTISY